MKLFSSFVLTIQTLSLTCAFFNPPAPRSYYAFGDSWAAGFPNAGSPLPNRPFPHYTQYSSAYPVLFANLTRIEYPSLKFQSFAYKSPGPGTTLTEITTHILQHLPSDAQLVSIQGGLVDVEFPAALHHCDETPSVACSQRLQQAETNTWWEIGNRSFYRRMMLAVQAARVQAPGALVVLLGFPRFYGNPVDECFPSREKEYQWPLNIGAKVLSVVVKDRINEVLLRMNRKMMKIANRKQFGGKVVFKDSDEAFTGNHYCEGSPWLAPYNWTAKFKEGQFTEYGYFHPTNSAHQLYRRLLSEAWREHAPQDPGTCMAEGTCEL